jgi:hypothetical protein
MYIETHMMSKIRISQLLGKLLRKLSENYPMPGKTFLSLNWRKKREKLDSIPSGREHRGIERKRDHQIGFFMTESKLHLPPPFPPFYSWAPSSISTFYRVSSLS